ncbi:MAG: hypothetical protein R3C58_07040 [Parvularculaceae bacterium]
MTDAYQGKTVLELQELANQSPAQLARRRKPGLSRAARLHLIDVLSRWAGFSLAILTGAGVYLAILAGRTFPGRAAAWVLLMLAALYACRRFQSQFRAGLSLASRPFRWRAAYTACLAVLGVTFASAPILLSPASAPAALSAQIAALMFVSMIAAALLHAAHGASAASLAVPGAIFATLAGVRAADSGMIIAAIATSLLALTGLFVAARMLERSAARRYPRTTLQRRETGRRRGTEAAPAQSGPAALQA